MGAPQKKKYKRSWRNLLLDKSYQLKFTLFMVGLCAVLMAILGWWVMRVAHKATTVSKQNIPVCSEPPSLGAGLTGMPIAPAADYAGREEPPPGDEERIPLPDHEANDPDPEPDTKNKPGADAKKSPAAGTNDKPAAGDDAEPNGDGDTDDKGDEAPNPDEPGDGERARPRVKVTLDATPAEPIALPPALPEQFVAQTIEFYTCRMQAAAQTRELADGQRLILLVLIGVGIMLVIGIAMYGIKMTHKVAGPLFKVQLYLAKMKQGRYDSVWNLRKGDQLIEFYAHFKDAHAGMRRMEEQDVERLRAMLAAADKADLGGKSPEIDAALDEMRATLTRKDEGLE